MTFKYDPFGRRIQKNSPSGTTDYLHDGRNSVAEVDATGTMLARYAQGVGVDEPLAELRSGTAGYYEQDGLGSVTSLSDSTSALVNTYTYDAFGNVAASTGTFTNPFQYTGRDTDLETGLRYYRARYYDASTGRFISEDPLRFEAGANFYSYAGSNPVNFSDPYGLCPDCKIVIRCWPIDAYHVGPISTWFSEQFKGRDLGAKHCFIEFVTSDGKPWGRFSGGPENKVLRMYPTPQNKVTPDPKEPKIGWPVYYQRAVDCNDLFRLQDISEMINQQNFPYRPATQNSNSAMVTLLDSIGLGWAVHYMPPGAIASHRLPLLN